METQRPVLVDPELVPTHPGRADAGVHRVHGDDGLVVHTAARHVAIHHTRHHFVALCIEAHLGAGLRHTAGQLTTAQILIGLDRNLRDGCQSRLRRVRPVHMKIPHIHAIVIHIPHELGSTRGEHGIGRTGWRQTCAIKIRIVEEVDAVDDDALFGGRFTAEHALAIHHACPGARCWGARCWSA